VAHGGASIAHATAVDGFSVILFAYIGQTENDLISLYLNDEFANEVTIAKGEEGENTTLTIPSERFQRGRNNIKFSVKRPSQNEEFTKDLILLYRSSPPGDVPPVLAINVSHESIGADQADDVSVTVTYKNAQWYDRIFVDCNGVVVRHQLVPEVEPPVSAAPQTVVIPIAREVLEQGGNDTDFTFKFRVVDNLTNPNGPPTWSDIVNADVHLDRITLAMPILREIPTENNDDPAIVDLAKLNGGPLWALIHLNDEIWDVGDKIHLTFTALVNGSPVATYDKTLPITPVPGPFSWDIPNSNVIADSVVTVIYEQVRSGAVIARSKTATAQVTGAGQNDVPTFTNAPYTIAPAGRLKNVELLLSTSSNTPVPGGSLSLILPANFRYDDGGSGQRDFITDDVGRLSVSRVKGALIPGSYSLSATSGAQSANATVTVTGLGPVGSISVGNRPIGIAVSPDGTRAYVCNQSSHSVSVIDTATNRVLTNISVGTGPYGIAVSPDGTHAYVSNSSSHTVSLIDTETNRVLTNIPVGNHPTGVAVSPDGTRTYVSNYVSGTVSVIDTATDRVLTNIPVGNYPTEVAFSPDGTRAYVCNRNSHTVSVIDTATDRVLTDIPVGNTPGGVAVSPDGTRAYVCNISSATAWVIDTATNQVLTTIGVGGAPYGIAVSPDGTRAYVSNHTSHTVSVIDTATNRVLTNIPVGNNPFGLAVSPDGTRIYVCNYASHTVSVIGG
jgi:YVTN family beta-propeller protein